MNTEVLYKRDTVDSCHSLLSCITTVADVIETEIILACII